MSLKFSFKLFLFCINVLLKLNWCLTSHLSFRLLNHTICKSWKSCVILFNVFLFFLPGGGMSIAKRKSILVSFYKSVVGTLFPPHELAASLTGTPVAYTLLKTQIKASNQNLKFSNAILGSFQRNSIFFMQISSEMCTAWSSPRTKKQHL